MKNKSFCSAMLSLIVTIIVLFSFGGIIVLADETDEPEIVASGYCGAAGHEEDVSWTLDSNGLLNISGTGGIASSSSLNVWKKYQNDIKEVNIINGVTSIGYEAFYGCQSLTSITIPSSVTSIGAWAFSHCTSLASVNIAYGVSTIGIYAFEYCTSLITIQIPDSVNSIGDNAFNYCTSLKSIAIPDSVTKICDGTFENCTSLTSITLSNSVGYIGAYAFNGCSSLTSALLAALPREQELHSMLMK